MLPKDNNSDKDYISYVDASNSGKEQIGGIILRTNVDLTHPLGFGLEDTNLPVYKNNTIALNLQKIDIHLL